jgi:uncharacterized protein (DUF362 family)
VKRRTFIKSAALALPASRLPFRKLFETESNPVVYEISGAPEKSISLLFSKLGTLKNLMNQDITKSIILVKPNLCLPDQDSSATTTSVSFLKALCDYMLNEGVSRVIIADHTLQNSSQFGNLDIFSYVKTNPKLSILLANEQRYYVPKEINGRVLKDTEILKIIEKTDYFINVPTAKHHSATHVSLSLKNLLGVIWDRKGFHTSFDLHQGIADLAKSVRPNLNIVDASRVLLNNGPVGPGPIENANKIYASTDMVALDSIVIARHNFGGKSISAKDIPHISASYKNGVGEYDLNKIIVEKLEAG